MGVQNNVRVVSAEHGCPKQRERADAALYYAKHHGRNNVQSFELLVETGELKPKKSSVNDVELF